MQSDERHGGAGGKGGAGGPGGDGGIRKIVMLLVPVIGLFVALVVWNLWDSRATDDKLMQEQQERTAALCETTVQARANQLISSEVLILASTGGSEPADPDRRKSVDRFRTLQERIWLSELPATCDGIMRLDAFRRKIREQVSEATSDLAP